MSGQHPICFVNPKRQLFAADAVAWHEEAKRAEPARVGAEGSREQVTPVLVKDHTRSALPRPN